MESKRSKKLSELNKLLTKRIEIKLQVDTVRDTFVKILSWSFHARDQILFWQEEYKEHLKLLRFANRDSPEGRIVLQQMKVNFFQEVQEYLIDKFSSLLTQLHDISNNHMHFITELEEKREVIKNAKTLLELENISFGNPTLLNSILVFNKNEMECHRADAMDWAAQLRENLASLLDQLRCLVAEERAELREI